MAVPRGAQHGDSANYIQNSIQKYLFTSFFFLRSYIACSKYGNNKKLKKLGENKILYSFVVSPPMLVTILVKVTE